MDDILRGLKDLLTGQDDQQQEQPQNVLSSDQDPYGDPGAGGFQNASYGGSGNVVSSDQDPYGDPGQNVLSSDQDPYGDPGRG